MYHLTGLTKGYIKIGDKVRKKGKIYYKCKCTHCGKEWEERTDTLVHGDKGDCGCLGTKANIKLSAEKNEEEKLDINIKIKPNGDIIIDAYNDTYKFDIYKAPEVIQKLNPNMFTIMQMDAINHLKYLIPETTNILGK